MANSEYQRGYVETRNKLENMSEDKKDWLPNRLKQLARNQEPPMMYDRGTEDVVIHYQHGIEWKF